jgi:TonB family protein
VKPTRQWAALLIFVAWGVGWARSQEVVCDRGEGHFEGSFRTGVTVRVGAVASGGFATRDCEAVLRWGNERVVAVQTAAQVDIDVLGVDMGLDVPVVAFVVRSAQDNWQASYEIWSMEKKPRLLRTLTGGDSYRAVDADFNQQVAIWTTDAVAVEGFDGLTHADYSSPPMVVVQFERGGLVDVSAWYGAQYDRQIAELRGGLTAEALAEFRKSDGRLESGSVPAAEWVRLRNTKAVVLEMVWAYMYSGRPDRAWAELEGAWPSGDVARVKAAIVAARARGIEAKVTKVASAPVLPKHIQRAFVYEYLKPVAKEGQTAAGVAHGASGLGESGAVHVAEQGAQMQLYEADTGPKPILLWRPPPSEAELARVEGEETVELMIDEAGKVESARMVAPGSDPELLRAAKGWKFIPASRNERPVAYKLRMVVQPYR